MFIECYLMGISLVLLFQGFLMYPIGIFYLFILRRDVSHANFRHCTIISNFCSFVFIFQTRQKDTTGTLLSVFSK